MVGQLHPGAHMSSWRSKCQTRQPAVASRLQTGQKNTRRMGSMDFSRVAHLACLLVLASRCVASFGLQGKDPYIRRPGPCVMVVCAC